MAEEGFRSDFHKLISSDGVYTYILKGGAGTGKSSLMKKIAAEFEGASDIVTYCCSSDPESLDAVYVKKANALVVDGTAPHTFDPEFPAVKQMIVNLGDHWNGEILREHTSDIIGVTLKHRGYMNTVKSYVAAMTKLFDDTYFSAQGDAAADRIEALAEKTAAKLFAKKCSARGKAEFSLLSAISPKGYMTQTETLEGIEKVFIVKDDYYAAGDIFLKKIADEAMRKGYDVMISKSNMFTQSVYEFVIIKELGMAFALSSPMNGYENENAAKINVMRFYDKNEMAVKKARLKMNKNACAKLLEETAQTLTEAKKVHDEIEKYYIAAMDFSSVDDTAEKLCRLIDEKLAV